MREAAAAAASAAAEDAGRHHLPEANGDGAGAGAAEMESLKDELQRALEALKASEASRVGVEDLLAEAKQVIAASCMN